MSPEIFNRAAQLAKMMANTYLRASVWRVVWSMPLVQVLVIAGAVFIILSVWG